MTGDLDIRESRLEDVSAIEAFYPEAFPDEDLLPLLRELLSLGPALLSLVGVLGGKPIGHIVFTRCTLPESEHPVALLGPLAIAPAYQRQGIGSALIRAGLIRQREADTAKVCVLGDPAYYGRLGFVPERDITPPYPLPEAWDGAWQSQSLIDPGPPLAGKLNVPEPWQNKALWTD